MPISAKDFWQAYYDELRKEHPMTFNLLSPNAACKRANRRGYKTTRVKGQITVYDRAGNVVLKDAEPDAVNAWLHRPPQGAPETRHADDQD